jgi:protein SCO1/2
VKQPGVRYRLVPALCLWLVAVSAVHADAVFRLPQWPAAAPSPAFSLQDGDGRTRTLNDFRGRVVIVFFGFTHCPDVCPAELAKMAQVVRELGPSAGTVRVVFVSLDPQRDTPRIIRGYAAAFNPTFIGLSGSAAAVNAAAVSFSVQFAKVPLGHGDYTVDHSTGSYVFDRHGRLRLVGTLATPVADWVHDLRTLAQEPAP